MTKLKRSSISSERVTITRPVLWISPYSSPETLTHMKRTEAREWLKRYRDKAKTDGAAQANLWWRKTIMDIERIRGFKAATELRHLMNLERKK